MSGSHSDRGPTIIEIGGSAGTRVGAVATAAAGVCTATIAAVAGRTNYLTGLQITGLGATAATKVIATVTGLVGGTKSFAIAVPAGVTTAVTPIIVAFPVPVPATGVNVAIVASVPSFGAGNTDVDVNLDGFQS